MKQTQELILELQLKVTTPVMPAAKLAKGIKKIIAARWPVSEDCLVSLEDIVMISISESKEEFEKRTNESQA